MKLKCLSLSLVCVTATCPSNNVTKSRGKIDALVKSSNFLIN
uniref:Uncharacterized protein n=1 Tax=Arundo donax TaxID=35708 RepID=A0A0A9ACF5_ARUDO